MHGHLDALVVGEQVHAGRGHGGGQLYGQLFARTERGPGVQRLVVDDAVWVCLVVPKQLSTHLVFALGPACGKHVLERAHPQVQNRASHVLEAMVLVVHQEGVHDDDVPAMELLSAIRQHIDTRVVEHRRVEVGVRVHLLLGRVFQERFEQRQLRASK